MAGRYPNPARGAQPPFPQQYGVPPGQPIAAPAAQPHQTQPIQYPSQPPLHQQRQQMQTQYPHPQQQAQYAQDQYGQQHAYLQQQQQAPPAQQQWPPPQQRMAAPPQPRMPPQQQQRMPPPQAQHAQMQPLSQGYGAPNGVSAAAQPMRPAGMRPAPPARPLPASNMRPIPGGVSSSQQMGGDVAGATAGLQQLSMGNGAGGYAQGPPGGPGAGSGLLPQGLNAPPVTDPAFMPRPDLSGSAIAVRVRQGDLPVASPALADSAAFDPAGRAMTTSGDPVACPREIFVPTSPRCVRLTAGAFPNSMTLAKKYGLPLGAVIHPLAEPGPDEDPVPVVNFGGSGIVRCRRCRSYVNFSCKFTGGGRNWVCSMCNFVNDCPAEYFSPLDQDGRRRDAAQRPELHRGTIELVAPAEYMVRPPMPPVYLFVLEVTPAATSSSALAAMISGIKRSIDAMPNEGRTRVGVVTFDSAVHFYNLRPGEDAYPSVSVVSDISDMFLPTPDSILAQLSECRPAFEKSLDMIAESYGKAQNMQNMQSSSASCLGAAIQGAKKALEYTGGKMVVFAASRPTTGPGTLRDRGEMSLFGTDRERAILRPDISFYRQIAVEMSKVQIACDLFVCPPPPGMYMDLATLAQMSKVTGGELFFAPAFDAPQDAPRLQLAVHRMLSRETGFEAVMRIRATKSVRCTHFSGRFFTRSTDLLAMPGVDADKAYGVQFSFDESTLSDGPFCIQVALLYTTSSGERRLRVHTVAVPSTNSLAELYMRTDTPTMMNMFARMAAEGVKDRVLEEIRKNQMARVIGALAKYREACQIQAPGAATAMQLLMPDAMALLPLYMHGLAKSTLLSKEACAASRYRFDDKAALLASVDAMSVAETSAFLYPAMIPVYSLAPKVEAPVKHPHGAPASLSTLRPDTGVVIDHGSAIYLWLGSGTVQQFTSELLGKQMNVAVDPRILSVELLRRAPGAKGRMAQVAATVTSLLQERRAGVPFHVIPAGDQQMQARIESLMTEDRSAASVGYKDFLCEVQRQVSMKVSSKR